LVGKTDFLFLSSVMRIYNVVSCVHSHVPGRPVSPLRLRSPSSSLSEKHHKIITGIVTLSVRNPNRDPLDATPVYQKRKMTTVGRPSRGLAVDSPVP
jgi:hypothetical protein